jgi:hypothetical protein
LEVCRRKKKKKNELDRLMVKGAKKKNRFSINENPKKFDFENFQKLSLRSKSATGETLGDAFRILENSPCRT